MKWEKIHTVTIYNYRVSVRVVLLGKVQRLGNFLFKTGSEKINGTKKKKDEEEDLTKKKNRKEKKYALTDTLKKSGFNLHCSLLSLCLFDFLTFSSTTRL